MISLVMAVYNGKKYLREQLESIRKQTKQVDEAIFIDDCSTDDSVALIEEYIEEFKLDNWIVYKNNENLGYKKNFRKGLYYSKGDIVFLCDQDDRWHLNKVEIMSKYMNDNRILTLASSFYFMGQDGKIFSIKQEKGKSNNNLLYEKVKNDLTNITLKSLCRMNFSQGCCMAIKRKVIDEYLQLSNDVLPHDWELNMIAASHNGCYYLNLPLIDYRIHENNTIGLSNIIQNNVTQEKKKRVEKRAELISLEMNNLDFALSLNLDSKKKHMCDRNYKYLNYRKKCIKNKKFFHLIVYFLKGQYREFGQVKTFFGDLLSVVIPGE